MIIQTILLDPTEVVWTDEAANVSRSGPSGPDQVDIEHQATDLVVLKAAEQQPLRTSPSRSRGGKMESQAAARRWAATWTAAWQAHDVEAVVALYADDCVHHSTPFRPPHRGRQAVRDYVTQAFADEQRIDDVRFGTPIVEGDRACVEYWARFLDQQGTAMTLAGCAMARFDADGLITEARDYWHLQEGHEPPPEWDR
jgi:uncharacterized protein (TIGR02246 family)